MQGPRHEAAVLVKARWRLLLAQVLAGTVIEQLLSARELAEILGFSASTVVDWAEAGRLPAFKVGGRLRFRESEVLAWLETKRAGREEEKLSTTPHMRPARGVVSLTSTTPHRGGEEDA